MAPYQTLRELHSDEQVLANGYLPSFTTSTGQEVHLVASPAQFDEIAIEVTRAPEHGENTELLLVDAGFTWDEVAALKASGAIL